MERSEKQEIVESVSRSFSGAQVALCADYRGLTVAKISALRRELHNVGSVGVVVKNTLAELGMEKAFASAASDEVKKFAELLKGPTFLAFSTIDPISPAKVFAKFSKENEKFSIKGGWFSGACLDSKGVQQLSTMPSREEILAKLLALINTPATQLLRVMKAPSEQTVRVIEAQRKKLEGAQAA